MVCWCQALEREVQRAAAIQAPAQEGLLQAAMQRLAADWEAAELLPLSASSRWAPLSCVQCPAERCSAALEETSCSANLLQLREC